MLDLLAIGDVKLDTFITLDGVGEMQGDLLCIPSGKKNPVQAAVSQIAGSAPNVTVALTKMHKKSAVLSAMGDDATHTIALQFLKQYGVNTSHITASPKHHSSSAAVLNLDGESTQLVAHGTGDIRLPSTLPKTRWIYVSELGKNYEKLFRGIIAAAKANGARIGFNPGQVQINERKKILFDLIAATDVLFLNFREARELLVLPTVEVKTAAQKLFGLGAKHVVITDGRSGAYTYDGTTLLHAPMYPGKRVEATGAGDAFASGYLGALLHGESIQNALGWASINAASVVGQIGGTAGLLSHTDLAKRLRTRAGYKIRKV